MGVYDQAARYAGTTEPGFLVGRLHPLIGLALVFRRWFKTRTVPLPGGPDRDADLVAVADDPADADRPWLFLFEFQAQRDADKAKVALLEALVLLVHAKDTDRAGGPFLPLPVFVYMRDAPAESGIAVRTPTGKGFSGDPAVWDVAADSASETLAAVASGAVSWGAMFWIPLMAGADDEKVIAEWRRLRDDAVPENRRADVVSVALTFAELVGRRRDWERMTEGLTMTESPLWNEIMAQGEMRATRESLRRVVRGRFPEAMTPDVERAIADQPSLDLLRDWLDAVATSRTAEEFLAVLRR